MSTKTESERLLNAVARVNTMALAFVFAILCGLSLFVMTVFLLIKGGDPPGPHLQLLGQFFIGYTVSWPGSFLGLFYGLLFGAVVGGAIGFLYNKILMTTQS